jgi:hypothetical protein
MPRTAQKWNAVCWRGRVRLWLISAVVIVALTVTACGGHAALETVPPPPTDQQLAELWIDPGPTPRDLFWGVGGKRYAPPADAVYTVRKREDSGFSVGYDVVGPDGTEWSAKIGPEAQAEVVVSRILWGLGYHQPPVYYLPSWKGQRKDEDVTIESEARFRPKLAELERLDEYWRWNRNPFVGTRELKALLVTLLILNSTDLKDDNNSTYRLRESWEGATRWYVVRDLGASLGEIGKINPRRNWLEGFEKEGFVKRLAGGRVEFDYDGRHRELFDTITPADLRWGAGRLRRLTDEQWHDAFRAAGYAEPERTRFIRRIKQKIEDGVALRAAAGPKER